MATNTQETKVKALEKFVEQFDHGQYAQAKETAKKNGLLYITALIPQNWRPDKEKKGRPA